MLANGALHRLLGTTPAIVGRPLRQALPRARLHALADVLDQVRASGEPAFAAECALPPPATAPAALRYYSVEAQPYYISPTEARPSGILAVAYETTAQVLAHQLASTTEGHYHTLLEESPVSTALYLGPELRIAYANPPMLRYWGKGSSVLGLPFAEVLSELVGLGSLAQLLDVYTTGQTYAGTRQAATLLVAGVPCTAYYTFTCQALRTPEGRIYGVHHTSIDVTAEVLALQQTADAERRFRALIEQAPVAITLTKGAEAVVECINAPMLRLLGRATATEVLGWPLPQALPPLAAQVLRQIMQDVAHTGAPYHGQEMLVELSGPAETPEQRYFNLSCTPLLEAGTPAGLIHVAVDVTEQVHARQLVEASQAALRKSEERFRIMADVAPNPMWAVNPAAGLRYVNRAFLEFLGLTLPEYLATSWTAFLHPDDAAEGLALMQLSIAERSRHVQEYRLRRHDGQYRWLLTQGAPGFYEGGELHGYVGAAIDITELKEANKRLARTNADLDNFIYTASHDLKAPIVNIEGLLTMLEADLPPGQRPGRVHKVLGLMHTSVNRFKRTLADLTDVARLQQASDEPPTLVSLPAVLDEVCLDLSPLLHNTGAQLVRELRECPEVHFSAKNLRSVVYNLLSNALKYRHPERPPVVHFTCHTTPEHHVLTVADNGLGFPPGREAVLFGLFQRLHAHVEGTGVGLYMVRKMLENAGGRIEAHGEVGVGATFTVYFRR
jgi:PAS domain S-box-containing protein